VTGMNRFHKLEETVFGRFYACNMGLKVRYSKCGSDWKEVTCKNCLARRKRSRKV